MSCRYVQIHWLTSYPASLLNRDDTGGAKTIPFGGTTRQRISSQCLKRAWRTSESEHALSAVADGMMSVRSRDTFDQLILQPLVAGGLDAAFTRAATQAVMVAVLGQSAAAARKGRDTEEPLETGQVTVLGRAEVEYLKGLVKVLVQEAGKPENLDVTSKRLFKPLRENLAALRLGAGIDAALFGRMVTSDVLARCDAAVCVQHAFTVHEHQSELDYFSALDDLRTLAGTMGSGHINQSEITTGVFYGYCVVDVGTLVDNVGGDRQLAGRTVKALVSLIATTTPAAKRGSTAPFSYAHTLLVEVGSAQPCTLANAFLRPVALKPDVMMNAISALVAEVERIDTVYGVRATRRLASMRMPEGVEIKDAQPMTVPEIAAYAGVVVTG